jgi:hypothetical protein
MAHQTVYPNLCLVISTAPRYRSLSGQHKTRAAVPQFPQPITTHPTPPFVSPNKRVGSWPTTNPPAMRRQQPGPLLATPCTTMERRCAARRPPVSAMVSALARFQRHGQRVAQDCTAARAWGTHKHGVQPRSGRYCHSCDQRLWLCEAFRTEKRGEATGGPGVLGITGDGGAKARQWVVGSMTTKRKHLRLDRNLLGSCACSGSDHASHRFTDMTMFCPPSWAVPHTMIANMHAGRALAKSHA